VVDQLVVVSRVGQDGAMVPAELVRRAAADPLIAPRDRHIATRAVASLMLAGAAFVGVLSLFVPGYGGTTPFQHGVTYAAGVLVAIGGVVCWRYPHRIPDGFWAGVPIGAVVLIGGLNYLTSDVTAGAQLFFLWPTLYAATFLNRRLIYAVLVCVFVAEALLVFALETPASAAADLAGLMTALTMATVVIVTLRRRLDELLGSLESQALEDELTGLANRRAFDRDVAHAVSRARRTCQPLSLLTIDVDHFKVVNDTHGHAAGDQALQAVAQALRMAARESDMLARIGGDEFVALLLDCDAAGAHRMAATLQSALADSPVGALTLSIGIATMPSDADTVESLSIASDAALYDAKLHGRNRIVAASELRGRP
jgi:diguanylate cyclase (GGDEF)-like protein